MTPKVYIETTIPSHYHDTRNTPKLKIWREATREWWHRSSGLYHLVTSKAVLTEIRAAPQPKASRMLALLDSLPLLDEPPRVAEIADFYARNRLLPGGVGGDAYHLAIASLHGVDYMLTWNCRHLANANKMKHIAVLNKRLGLSTPVITTPQLLIPENDK